VNELRRQALETPLQKRETLRPWPVRPAELPPPARRSAPARPALWARFQRWEQAPEEALAGVEKLILPLAEADRVPQPWRSRTILELPGPCSGGWRRTPSAGWRPPAGRALRALRPTTSPICASAGGCPSPGPSA